MAIASIDLPVLGMTCYNCARTVERTLASVPGVTKVSVDLKVAAAHVEYDPGLVTAPVMAEAVRDLGYEVPA
jgi:Cu+-exporting ATPase